MSAVLGHCRTKRNIFSRRILESYGIVVLKSLKEPFPETTRNWTKSRGVSAATQTRIASSPHSFQTGSLHLELLESPHSEGLSSPLQTNFLQHRLRTCCWCQGSRKFTGPRLVAGPNLEIMKLIRCSSHKLFVCIFCFLPCFFVVFYALRSKSTVQYSKSAKLISRGASEVTGQSSPNKMFVATTNVTIALAKNQPTESMRGGSSVSQQNPAPQMFVHTFFYAWYGTRAVDNSWIHWNHPILPHW